MQQHEQVSGFSDLKDILIRTFQIGRDRAHVKLYFSTLDNALLMHDYDDHKKVIVLSRDIKTKVIKQGITGATRELIIEALMHHKPQNFLNDGFKLNGFFIS